MLNKLSIVKTVQDIMIKGHQRLVTSLISVTDLP